MQSKPSFKFVKINSFKKKIFFLKISQEKISKILKKITEKNSLLFNTIFAAFIKIYRFL